ncbi:MAG: GNAT family N-acetyltransferase, partial [Bacteroidetes bacterium]|nr:GNAT family N-acetyltransferase [Bacteroidota bacterium]
MESISIETDRLILTNVLEDDCNETYLGWLKDKEVTKYLETNGDVLDVDDLINTIRNLPSNTVFLAIRLKEGNKHIGNIKIHRVNMEHRTAEYGVMVGDRSEWGKGYAREATVGLLDHCFTTLGLRKIVLGVINENKRATQMYVDMGFVTEGILSKQFKLNELYLDEIPNYSQDLRIVNSISQLYLLYH